jgi:hypothetical protein
MATGTVLPQSDAETTAGQRELTTRTIVLALGIAVLFVVLTRWPVARTAPFESDEFGFLERTAVQWFPIHHTLFLTSARLMGQLSGGPYRGFIVLDMLTSAGAILSVWWMLRAMVRPATAAAATLVLAVAPVFWGYGAMAANYTAIVLVGAFLLGLVFRGGSRRRAWHPFAGAVALAVGTGYRQDLGTLWLAVFGLLLWQHRWKRAFAAALLFAAVNLAWLSAMLHEAGGWDRYRALSADFAYQCGFLNSIWHLGFIDGPLRYAVKLGIALVWTLGPALVFVPRGLARLGRLEHGLSHGLAIALAALPALGSHLLVHFGSTGWCFHYVPGLLVLAALGVDRARVTAPLERPSSSLTRWMGGEPAALRLVAIAAVLATLFLCYPTDYAQPGWRGDFDLSFCRFTRIGLQTPSFNRAPEYWRTVNSRPVAGAPARPQSDKPPGSG